MGSVARTALKPSKRVSLFLSQCCRRSYGLALHLADSQSKSIIVNTASVEETRRDDDWFGDEVENKRYG